MRKDLAKKEFDFLYDDDIRPVLERIGILSEFDAGNIKCRFCQTAVNMDNFHSMFREDEQIRFSCNGRDCIEKLLAYK